MGGRPVSEFIEIILRITKTFTIAKITKNTVMSIFSINEPLSAALLVDTKNRTALPEKLHICL